MKMHEDIEPCRYCHKAPAIIQMGTKSAPMYMIRCESMTRNKDGAGAEFSWICNPERVISSDLLDAVRKWNKLQRG